jgi:hypothetical protein
MKLFCSGLLMGALLWCVASSRAQSPPAQNRVPAVPAAVAQFATLTNSHPEGFFVVPPSTVAAAPLILNLRVAKVVNPTAAPVAISAYLVPAGEQDPSNPQKFLVGSFSLNPPDKPGSFVFVATSAFRQINAAASGSGPDNIRLLLEMNHDQSASADSSVAVTIAPPIWRNTVHPD